MKYLHLINNKHWVSEIKYIGDKSIYNYSVTSKSNNSSIEPMTLCDTFQQAEMVVIEHMNQVRGI